MFSVIHVLRLSRKIVYVLIAWMYVFSSSNANEIELAQLSEGFNAQQKYMASCFACHSTGAAGAPKVGAGMSAEWEPRLEKAWMPSYKMP